MSRKPDDTTSISKFLSLVLRHKPEKIGLKLGEEGWVATSDLLEAMAHHGRVISLEQLSTVVETNEKKRFSFNSDRSLIRAVQGHSVSVDLGYVPTPPPDQLYHGTVDRFLSSIRAQGLLRGRRQHVHLSRDSALASVVGARRGKPVILTVRSSEMAVAELRFYLAENGVWLTDHVPPEYIGFPDDVANGG